MFTSASDIILAVAYFLILYFSIFWLLALLEREEVKRVRLKRFPLVSILIPAYNEEKTIRACLESVLRLDYPALEAVVINDGSTDRTQHVVQSIKATASLPIILINQENKGKGAALNAGLQRISGEFYATLDADSVVEPTLLKKLLPYFSNQHVTSVLPLLKIKNPKNLLQRIQRYEYIINMFHKLLNAMLDSVHVTPGPFSLYRTAIVKQLGGYDEHNITEDLEIALRLQKHHFKIIQTGETGVYTIPPDNLRDLYHQRNRWYKGAVINSFAYRSLMFRKDYGDFGIVRLPTVILAGILSIVVLSTLAYDIGDAVVHAFVRLSAINFDIVTLLINWSLNFHVLDLRYLELSVAFSVLALSFLVMVVSFRFCREKVSRYGRTFASFISYTLLYSFLLSFVWLMIGIDIFRGKIQKW